MIIVYQIKNLVTGSLYIGVTNRGLDVRKKEHLKAAYLSGYKTGGYKIGAAIRKYGKDNFEFSVIRECGNYDEALQTEMELIALYRPRYNTTSGGMGTGGRTVSAESRERMRQAKLANPPRYWLGKKRSQETIDKIVATKGAAPKKPLSERALAVLREKVYRWHKRQKKPVYCLSDGRLFPSQVEAAEFYGVCQSNISFVCLGKAKSIKGLSFAFVGGGYV